MARREEPPRRGGYSMAISWILQRELEVSTALPTIRQGQARPPARTTSVRRRLQGLRDSPEGRHGMVRWAGGTRRRVRRRAERCATALPRPGRRATLRHCGHDSAWPSVWAGSPRAPGEPVRDNRVNPGKIGGVRFLQTPLSITQSKRVAVVTVIVWRFLKTIIHHANITQERIIPPVVGIVPRSLDAVTEGGIIRNRARRAWPCLLRRAAYSTQALQAAAVFGVLFPIRRKSFAADASAS